MIFPANIYVFFVLDTSINQDQSTNLLAAPTPHNVEKGMREKIQWVKKMFMNDAFFNEPNYLQQNRRK